MKYIGYFKNINEISYKVEVDTGGTGETEVIMGVDPFVVSYEGDSTIYKPLKLSSASLKLVSNNYLFDIYNAEAQGTKIQLFKNDTELEWSGYVEPNLYSQDFNQENEIIEINAIDALSTLDYFKYETLVANKKGIVNFTRILLDALQKASGDYTKVYISMSNQRSDYNPLYPECIFNKLNISEQNFFDEDGKPMTYKEVMGEMLTYFGFTMIAYKDSIYILDYDAIKAGYNEFFVYQTIDNFTNHSTYATTLLNTKMISASDITESGSSITLDEVFNKITLTTSLYNLNSLLPDIWETDDLTNYTNIWNTTEIKSQNHTNNEDGTYQRNHYYRYYLHSKYKSYYYNKSTWAPLEIPTFNRTAYATTGEVLNTFIKSSIGATIVRYVNYKADDVVSKLDFEDYILLHRHLPASSSDGRTEKVFELKANIIPSTTYSETSYLVISADALWDNREGCMYIDQDYIPTGDGFNLTDLRLNCLLRVGNKYWTGTQWSTYTREGFWLPFGDNNTETNHYLNKWFSTTNSVDYRYEIEGTGYAIPITKEDNLMGDVEFLIYSPYYVNSSKRVDAVWLKGLEMKIYRPYISPEDSSDTDTIYENVINDAYVKEGDEMSLKICTQTGKGWSYSSVFFENGNYLYTLKNIPLNVTQTPEKTIIQRYVNQYSTPSKILDISLKNDITPYSKLSMSILTGTFIVDTMEIDYFYDKNRVKLVEKK